MIPRVHPQGIRPRFPKPKSYLESFTLGVNDWETTDLDQLRRYASGALTETREEIEGQVMVFRYGVAAAAGCLSRVAIAHRWIAIQSSFERASLAAPEWARAVAYDYWSCRMMCRFHQQALAEFERGERSQKLRFLFLHLIGATIARCLVAGWTDRAIDLTRRTHWALDHDLFNDGGDEAYRRTQHFILRLIGNWQGWPERVGPACASDEPVFNLLVEHWRTPDPDDLVPLLLAACDRHTHQARPDNSKAFFDMPWSGMEYDPFEILAVLKLRELHGLANPTLDHPLMNTPLALVPPPTAPHSDELLEGVLARARHEFSDL